MQRLIIHREKDLCMEQEPLMFDDGSLSFHGMKLLESMWRKKEINKDKPFLHIIKGLFNINEKETDMSCFVVDTLQECLEDNKHLLSFEKPTFFLFAEASLHWIPLVAYRENKTVHLFIFDPALLGGYYWQSDAEILEDSSDFESEKDEIVYYRNETLFKDKERSHLSTDTGCGVFALKFSHSLFFYKDFNLDAFKMALNVKLPSLFEKEKGINFSFQLPKPLTYLSHLRETYSFAEPQKKRVFPGSPYNTTLHYFVEKSYTQLKERLTKNEARLKILNQFIEENSEIIEQAQKELVVFLKKEYQESPASSSGRVLPLTWEEFKQLDLQDDEEEQALKEYYQNRYHCALRYLLRGAIWQEIEPSYYSSPWYKDKVTYRDGSPEDDSSSDDDFLPPSYNNTLECDVSSPLKNLLPLIALLYLIAKKQIQVIQDQPVAVSKEKLINILAFLAREGNGNFVHFTYSQAVDNLLPDSPAAFFEAKHALLHLVKGIPFKTLRVQIQADLEEFIYQNIKSQTHFMAFFKKILDSQLDPQEFSQFNVSAEKIEELIVSLKQKYKEDFAFDSEFFIRKQVALDPCKSHFSKFYPLFESRYLEELKQKIQSGFSETNLNKAHELFNQYLTSPLCLHGLIKEKLTSISEVEGPLALLLIAHLENNLDGKRSFYEKINTLSETQEPGLFECSDAEIAAAILEVNFNSLRQENRNVKGFIEEHAGLLKEALMSKDAGVEIIDSERMDFETPRQRAVFFPSPSAKRRRINDNWIVAGPNLSM